MKQTGEALLRYQGLWGIDGLCHVRVYEEPGRRPVALVGQLDDNPGTNISVGIEMVAAALHASVFVDGREFELVGYDTYGPPRYARVEFAIRPTGEREPDASDHAGQIVVTDGIETAVVPGPPVQGDFRDPVWRTIDDIVEFLGTAPQEWAHGEYTAEAVFGSGGARVRAEVAARGHAAAGRLIDMLRKP